MSVVIQRRESEKPAKHRFVPRVSVKQKDKIIWQEVFEFDRSFDVGSRLSTDFNLPPEERIGSHRLFQWNKGRLESHLKQDFDGWIFYQGTKQPLESIMEGRKRMTLKLDEDCYGVIKIAGFDFAFDYVSDLVLPKQGSIKENLRTMDWTLLYFILPLLSLQIAFSTWVMLTKDEKKPELQYEVTQNRLTNFKLNVPKPPPPPKKAPPKTDGGGKKAGPKLAKPAESKPKANDAAKAKQLAKVRSSGLLALIGAKQGAVGQLLSGSNLGKIDGALGRVVGKDVSKQIGELSTKFKSGDVKHVGIGNLGSIGGGTSAGNGAIGDAGVSVGDGELGDGTGTGTGTGSGSGDGKGAGLGGYDLNGAKKVIYNNIGALRYCYEKELKANPALGGSFVLEFTILMSGMPERKTMKLMGSEGYPNLSNCVLNKFARLQFPKPKSFEVTIRYPINFRSNQ
jgi:hypothetical protein